MAGAAARPDHSGMLAVDYPLLNLFWTILWFAMLIGWMMALFAVIGDVFRSHDMGGLAKGLWILLVLLMPFFGVLIYLIARGGRMAEHSAQDAASADQRMRSYVRDAAGMDGTGPADQLAKLADLRDQGVISDDEFQQGKARILASSA
jgi:hypothetical protein